MERNRCLKKDVVKPMVQKVIPFGRSKIKSVFIDKIYEK